MRREQLDRIQGAMREAGIKGWLLCNFRDSNVIASRIIGLTPETHQTRRWALLIPDQGEPQGLVHRIEPHLATGMPGSVTFYSSQIEYQDGLKQLVGNLPEVAMEYSPNNALPVVAKVDAGTVELVRSFGTEVISSGELIARLESRLEDWQIESGIRAGNACREVMFEAFSFIRQAVEAGEKITEFDVVQYILSQFDARGLVTDHDPNCSVGANSANPHYQPSAESASVIESGSFVLIDLWGKEEREGSVYGDITWTGYVGEEVPEEYERVFGIVRDGRDASLEAVRKAFTEGVAVTGAELDDAARDIIDGAGFGEQFIHRTGHSISTDLHGAGTNLDNFETQDTRPILTATSFSIEPGIYLPNRFGIRSELDVIITKGGEVIVPSEPLQKSVLSIMKVEVGANV